MDEGTNEVPTNRDSKEVSRNFFQKRKKEQIKTEAIKEFESDDNSLDLSEYFSVDTAPYEPDYQADYQEYLDTFEVVPPIFEGPPLSFEDWKVINYSYELSHPVNLARLGFIPPGIAAGAGNAITGYASAVASNYVASKFSEVTANLEAGDMPAAANAFKSIMSDAAPAIKVVKGSGTDTSESGKPPKLPTDSGTFRYGHNTSSLNLNPKPIEISLDTGIDNTAYGQYFIDSSADFAPLHLTQARVSPNALNSNSKLSGFFNNVISIIFQNAAQANISFNVNAASTFSVEYLVLYLETISNALQIYYFYSSLITYEDTGIGRNEGMLKLRSMISNDDVDLLYQMGRLLRQYPIPPNLRELLFYLNQTYSQSSVPGSPLIKMMPIKFATTIDVNNKFSAFDSTNISLSFAAMQNTNFRTVGSMLARIAESWIDPVLTVPSGNVVHDPQFTTFFCNMPNASHDTTGAPRKTPSASGPDNNITFGTHVNKYDGALYALTNIYDTSTGAWTSNILDTSLRSGYATTRLANRISFFSGLSGTGFYPITMDANITYTRNETYTYISAAPVPFVTSGAQSAKGVNINSISETSYKLYEWLLNLDSLKTSSNRKDSRTSRPKKGYDRSKDEKE